MAEYDRGLTRDQHGNAHEFNSPERADEPYGKIQIGEYTLAEYPSEGCIWISKKSGEGGSFSLEKLEKHMAAFYDEHF